MNNLMRSPWVEPWPEDGLEWHEHCPLCNCAERTILHADLIDNTFYVAPGKWNLWQCAGCHSAYLDPRPTPETIHHAYETYYTHQASRDKENYASLDPLRKLRRQLVNGYTNWRFGTQSGPSSAFGVLAAFAIPGVKRTLDREYRHLPRIPKAGGRLLDVGCGDGHFLRVAATCGWQVTGLDPDPRAVANSSKHRIRVHQGGVEYFSDHTELFDVITLNHVIEHVHNPVAVLRVCYALLKPGGQIWLETPNIDSFGHRRFQQNWRGLEAPRHLVLFNRASLRRTLRKAGFCDLRDKMRPSPINDMFQSSFAMQRGCSPYEDVPVPIAVKLQVSLARLGEAMSPARREFLTIAASKAPN